MLGNITIVSRTRNRNDILRKTIANWLKFEIPIVLVDWRDDSCESAYEIVRDISGITLVETKYEYNWHVSMPRNLGAIFVKTRYMLQLDVDYLLSKDFFDVNILENNTFIRGNRDHEGGLCVTDIADFNRIGGYNENLIWYGHEDTELYHRLKEAGYSEKINTSNSISHIDHPEFLSICNNIPTKNISPDVVHQLRMMMMNFNGFVAHTIPLPRRINWTITQISANRYLAVRDNG